MTPAEKQQAAAIMGAFRTTMERAAHAFAVKTVAEPSKRNAWMIAALIAAAASIARKSNMIDVLMHAVGQATGAIVEQIPGPGEPANDASPPPPPRLAEPPALTICPECQRLPPNHFSWCHRTHLDQHFLQKEKP